LLHGVRVEQGERWSWILWFRDSTACEEHGGSWFAQCARDGDAVCQGLHANKVGLAGMALKTTSVTLSMLYRDVSDPDNPKGGPMYVAQKAFASWGLAPLGTAVGVIFCITLLISAITGGNMFQAWNVGQITEMAFGVPTQAVGIILALVVGSVIIGGIKRIGNVAGVLVPFMCILYVVAGLLVLIMNIGAIPSMFSLI
ncbi:MAG: alanine:cation symporter family protein, partial [Phycisphaerales bacterium]